jgi:hypothetical protein
MRFALNALSTLAIALVGIAVVGIFITYNNFIHRPMQGGWNPYRLQEFGFQIAPYILVFLALLGTRFRNSPRWLFFTSMTLLLPLSGYLLLAWTTMAFAVNHFTGLIPPIVFLILLSAHFLFICRPKLD